MIIKGSWLNIQTGNKKKCKAKDKERLMSFHTIIFLFFAKVDLKDAFYSVTMYCNFSKYLKLDRK